LGVSVHRPFYREAFAALCLSALALFASACQSPQATPLTRAAAGVPAPDLPPSNYELAAPGTVFVWRDLNSGKTTDELVGQPSGRMMDAQFGTRRSFGYAPNPWADNENTKAADVEPLYPLEVGKSVSYFRQPPAGRTKDIVTVMRTETLALPFGTVDTYVVETRSELVSGGWVGTATVWYAPAVRWQVQWEITDTAGDNRRRHVIEIRQP
jgi:hypothetical protein